MSKKLKKKSIFMVFIEIVSLIVLGIFLTSLQTNISVQSQRKNTEQKMQQVSTLLTNAEASAKQSTDAYDEVYQSKVKSLAYMAKKQAGIKTYTDDKMKECATLMNITNVLILDKEGNVLAEAEKSPVDFTRSRFNQLRTVFTTNMPSEPFQVLTGDSLYRYYGAKIDHNTMVVIEHNPEELTDLLDHTSSWKSIFGSFSIGMNGYAMVVSNKDYTFLYHPDEEVVGTDALDAGILVENLEDNYYTWMDIHESRFYSGVIRTEDAYVICAVPESDIISSRNVTVGIILFIFFAVMTIVITYAIFTMEDAEKNGEQNASISLGRLNYNKLIGRKTGIISAIGLILIVICSFYMQTLFSLSRQAMSNNQHVREMQETLDKYDDEVKLLTQQYNRRYLNKCQMAAYILTQKPELRTRSDLKELQSVLDVEAVSVFGTDGAIEATSASYTNFKLKDNPDDQSFEFNELLVGNDYLIQEARADDVSGEFKQYIGVSLRDESDNADGFVQICITPEKLRSMLAITRISSMLSNIKVGVNGFAFAVKKEDKTFAYYPESRLVGRNALDYGMKEKQFHDEYCDYLTINSEKYYGSSLETGHHYIYVVVPAAELYGSRWGSTLASMTAGVICLLIVFLLLAFDYQIRVVRVRGKKKKNDDNDDNDDEDGMIDITMPDGTTRQTTSASRRWSNISVKWVRKTPEQKISTVLRVIFMMLSMVICAGVLWEDHIFNEGSIISYVLNGGWEHGINIFAITGAILIICVVSVVSMVLREVLRLLAQTFSMRGETVCRLISSFLRYVAVIVVLYYCFALFGVDTATLLASAGILSLVIGLGAKSLVSDILAGLFIIFEGEFRVGDIVTIGDWRGTVVEIGIRTTKIEDSGKNIKIISNSSVSGVVNMTREHSFACCEVAIAASESLEQMEDMLKTRFPAIRKHLPEIVDGPFYNGVVALNASGVTIRISAQCKEGDRITVQHGLNREIKLLLDERLSNKK